MSKRKIAKKLCKQARKHSNGVLSLVSVVRACPDAYAKVIKHLLRMVRQDASLTLRAVSI